MGPHYAEQSNVATALQALLTDAIGSASYSRANS